MYLSPFLCRCLRSPSRYPVHIYMVRLPKVIADLYHPECEPEAAYRAGRDKAEDREKEPRMNADERRFNASAFVKSGV